jgi:adenylosuccinate synthase
MHINIDSKMEQTGAIGTTKRGIGPAYTTKMMRKGLRLGELANWTAFEKQYMDLHKELKGYFNFDDYDVSKELHELKEHAELLVKEDMIVDASEFMHQKLVDEERILIEGANATMLDIDHGTYPFVTSSSTNIGGACTGLGIPPDLIRTKIGVTKAYTTRVGGGPFPTELKDSIGEHMQTVGMEFGATTGRKRRCGWIDLVVLRYAHRLNNLSSLMMTKLDVLSDLPEIKAAVGYKINGKVYRDYMPSTIAELEKVECEYQTFPGWKTDISFIYKYKDLPLNARNFIEFVEEKVGVPISWVSNGPDRMQFIQK